jgi:hypothetical protein
MLFQHPWDAKADAEDDEDEVQAISAEKNEIIDDKTRFDNLSSKLQRYIANRIDSII